MRYDRVRPYCIDDLETTVKTNRVYRIGIPVVGAIGLMGGQAANACSSCGCTLNSDWSSQGYITGKGVSLDLRYDYFVQNELRAGTHSVDRGSLEIPNEAEVQQETKNRNTTLGIDYGISRNWGVALQVPYFDRFHTTIAEGDTDISTSHTRSIGDVRVLARYQGFSPDLSWGVQWGLKLPTGESDTLFRDGPQAGESLDRGLDPGTGTTDLLVGAYHVGSFGAGFSYFAQALAQVPLNSHHEFKPGKGLNVSVGARYRGWVHVIPQLQVNARIEDRESGAEADVENSGATLVFISPGLSIPFASRGDVYAFVQAPIYQRVNGLQLEAEYFLSVGVHYRY